MPAERQFRVWKGGLSGQYWAGMATRDPQGRWVMGSKRHDVTADIERIIAEAAAEGLGAQP